MKRLIACLAVALVVCAATAPVGGDTFSMRDVELKDWTPKGDITKVVGMKLYDLIDGFADIHVGFAYKDSEHLTIRKGKMELEVSVFRVDTPDNGYGLYSCLRERDGELLNVPDEASYGYGTAILWRGNYCVEVKDVSEEEAPKEEVLTVCKTLGQAIEGRHQPPKLVRAFPKEKLNYKGLIYFHHRHPLDQIYYVGTEDVLRLGTDVSKPAGAEAVYAEYQLPKGTQGILAIRYPKPGEAKKALDLYSASLRESTASSDDKPPWRTIMGKNGKQWLCFQKNKVLIVAIESSQPDAARAIIEKVAKALEPPRKPKPNQRAKLKSEK